MSLIHSSRRLSSPLVLCLAVAALAACVTPAQAQRSLRWKFEQGQTLDWKMIQDMDMTMHIGGQTQEVDNTFGMTMSMFVQDVDDDGTANLEITLGRMQMKMEMLGQTFEFDSDSDEAPQGPAAMIAKAMQPLMGMQYTMSMNEMGEVLEVDVPQETIDMLNKMPGMEQFGSMFDKESLQNASSGGFLPLPEQALMKGDTWSHESEMENPLLGKQTTTMHFVYQGTEEVDGRTLDRIDVDIDMDFGDGEIENPMGLKVTLESGDMSGKYYFDNEAGRVARSEMLMQMETETEVAGQVMQQDVDARIVTTLDPIEPDSESPGDDE